MLDIDIDSKYGVLFVRLFGQLTKDTRKKLSTEVIGLIYEVGIRNIVINIQNVNYIDKDGYKTLLKCYKICQKSMLCINPNQKEIIGNIKYVTDEMSAIHSLSV